MVARTTLGLVTVLGWASNALAEDLSSFTDAVTGEPGYVALTTHAVSVGPPVLDAETFDKLWQLWEEPARTRAEEASPEERRRLTLDYYGLTESPAAGDVPLQFTPDERGAWMTNCMICHQGKVAGKVIPGLPNSRIAYQTLIDDVAAVRSGRRFVLNPIPFSKTNGTTNAANLVFMLQAKRDAELEFRPELPMPKLLHHDLDAPPWWNVKKKRYLYYDGFAKKDARSLMQAALGARKNGSELKAMEPYFEKVLSYIESLEPPKYPWPTDPKLAARGKEIFEANCSTCHGTQGPGGSYPGKCVPIDEVGTDRARFDALTTELRDDYATSWLGRYGKKGGYREPAGYIAPPLDGVWASAPYLHNGSVPTLWHLMHADQRPLVWKRTVDGYDKARVGLEIEVLAEVPASARSARLSRAYYDTRRFGNSSAGHKFPEALSEPEKEAVLEYLKTL